MSIHNVVHTQVRFKINLPVLNSKKHLERPCDTTTETKKPKIQKSKAFVKGPKLLDFLVFLGFFWFFGFRPKETMFFFLDFFDFCWKTKKHKVFLVFLLGFW